MKDERLKLLIIVSIFKKLYLIVTRHKEVKPAMITYHSIVDLVSDDRFSSIGHIGLKPIRRQEELKGYFNGQPWRVAEP